MLNLEQIAEAYGAARCVLTTPSGERQETLGSGGTLVSNVERRGIADLAASLPEGHTIVLEDADVSLTLRREGAGARMRAKWADGPAYEERIEIPSRPTRPIATDVPAAAGSIARRQASAVAPFFEPDPASAVTDLAASLHDTATPLYVTSSGVYARGRFGTGEPLRGIVPPVSAAELGARSFRDAHGVRAAYASGAMAGGIGSAEMVIAMGTAGLLGFYGAGGLPIEVVERDVARIKQELGETPAGFNLLHNPVEPSVEMNTVELYLRHGCKTVSASAFMTLTVADRKSVV